MNARHPKVFNYFDTHFNSLHLDLNLVDIIVSLSWENIFFITGLSITSPMLPNESNREKA